MPLLTAAVAVVAAAAAAAAVVAAVVAAVAAVGAAPLAAVAAAAAAAVALVADLVAGRGLASTVIPAVAVMLSDILTPVHTDGLTRTGSAQECSGFEGTITFGMAAGLALGLVTLLVGFTNARPSRAGMCGRT